MDIIINESQKNKLLLETKSQEIPNKIKRAKNFAYNVIENTKKQLGLDLKFLLTWGASIGGIMHPLNEFINGQYPELNNSDVSLIIVGAVSIVFFNNEEIFNKIKETLKDKEILDSLRTAVGKTEELKNVFVKFLSSLNLSLHQMTNVISYAFIIPSLPSIYEIVSSGSFSSNQIQIIAKRIIASISITLSGILVKELIQKLVNRFSSKD